MLIPSPGAAEQFKAIYVCIDKHPTAFGENWSTQTFF